LAPVVPAQQGPAAAPAPAPQQTIAAQAARVQQTIAAQAQLVSEFEVNGLKVLVKKRAGSQTVAAGLYFRGGARNLTPENAGIESMTLDVASEASTRFPRERMRRELAGMASSIGSSAGLDYSTLTMISTKLSFARTWDLFTDSALNPRFDLGDFNRLRDRRLAALRERPTDPDGYLQDLQNRTAYVGHPYVNGPDGTVESIGRMTVADLRAYHKQMMQTSRMLLVVVGDVDVTAFRQIVEASLGKLPRGSYQANPPPELSFAAPSVDITTRSLPTNYVQGIFAAPALTSPDIYPMRVAVTILQQQVFQVVRVQNNLSYAPDAFLGTQGANIGGVYVSAVNANRAVDLILDQIAMLQNNKIVDDAVVSLAAYYLTNYYIRQETNLAQVGELAEYELIGGGWRNSLDSLEKLRQVTPADVQRVARKYIRNLHFVVLGDPKAIDKQIFMRQSAS
jgi:zinc protease